MEKKYFVQLNFLINNNEEKEKFLEFFKQEFPCFENCIYGTLEGEE